MTCMMVVAGLLRPKFLECLDEAKVFFKSFQAHSQRRPLFQIYTTKDCLFEVMHVLPEIYQPLEFIIVDDKLYQELDKGDPRYYKLEAYDVSDNQVFVFDTDIVWLDCPDNLFGWSAPLAMVHEKSRDCFNSGLVCINRAKLGDVYHDILGHRHDGGYGNDQNIVNSFFKGRISELDRKYNTLILECDNSTAGIIGLHMITKPWYPTDKGRCSETFTNQVRDLYRSYGWIADSTDYFYQQAKLTDTE